ncbi:MAG: phage capsid protein [Pseudomonadota bacterium]
MQTVEAHHKLTYSDNVKMVAQQMMNPLRNAVTIVPCDGEAKNMADLIEELDYIEGEDYSRTNPENPPKRHRRWLVRPTDISSGQLITKEEKFDQAMDPTSVLFRAHIKACERGVFDRILGVRKKKSEPATLAEGGIFGKVAEGKTPGALVALPTGNYVSSDYGETPGTHVGLTLPKMRRATEAMELEDFGLETEDEIWGMITPKQKTDLINLAVETGKNLNPFEVKNIKEGKPGELLGINWLFTNRLPVDSNGRRLIPLWSKANIICGMWQDLEGQIFNDGSSRNLPRILVDCYPTCGRVEDEGVRIIRCEET